MLLADKIGYIFIPSTLVSVFGCTLFEYYAFSQSE